MITAPLTTATRPRHHLHRRRPLRPRATAGDQQPGPPRTAPARRHHRPPGRDRCARPVSAARLLQPVRLRGARARLQRRGRRSAHRRHAAVRRSTGRAGAVARRLADAERRRGVAVGVRPAAAPRVDLRHRGDRTGGVAGARLRAGRTVAPRRAGAAAAGAGCGGAAATGASGGGRRREEAAGKSARQVRRMLADLDPELAPPADRVRPLGDGRYELKAVIDADCQQGLEQLRGLLSARGPAHDAWGSLSDAWSRRGSTATTRAGHRAERAAAVGPRTRRQPPRQLRRRSRRNGTALRRRSTPRVRRSPPAPLPHRRGRFGQHRPPCRRRAPRRRRPAEPLPGRSRRAPPLRRRSHALRAARFRRLSEDTCGNATAGGCSYVDPQTGRRYNSTHLIEIDHIVPHALGGGADPREPQTSVWRAHHRHRHAQGQVTA